MITTPVEANSTYVIKFAAHFGIQLTPWQRHLLRRVFPTQQQLRHSPRPLPIDSHTYRNRVRNRRKK